jgi:hypothetical protein
MRLQGDFVQLDAAGRRSELRDGEAGRRKHGIVTTLGIAAKEQVIEPKAFCEAEDNVGVGTCAAHGRDHRRTQLHTTGSTQASVEAGAQAFPLPRRGHRQNDVRILRGGIEKEVGMNVKLQMFQGAPGERGVRLGADQIGAK